MRRAQLKGATLVETLAALVIVAGVLALMGGFVFQVARATDQSDRKIAAMGQGAALFDLLEARLGHLVLVADPNRPRVPDLLVRPDHLTFVTRFVPPGPRTGLVRVDIMARNGTATVTLTDWPDERTQDVVVMAAPDLRFAPAGGNVIDGVPGAIEVSVTGRKRVITLGMQLPLDCVLTTGPIAQQSGALICPGVQR